MEKFIKKEHIIKNIFFCNFVSTEHENTQLSHTNRPSHGLAFYEGNTPRYIFEDGRVFESDGGIILYMPKGSTYRLTVEEGKNHTCFAINFSIDEDEGEEFEPFMMNIKNIGKFRELFHVATRQWRKKKPGYKKICISNLYNILYQMEKELELGYASGKNAEILAPALEFIHKNYTNGNISIPRLSNICKISEGYFRRIFKKHTGSSPLDYINDLKIEYAKELIMSESYRMNEIAELCGYYDVSSFSKNFKKTVGEAPSRYKKIR